ncbi:hypothetical protein E3N88_24138 [Mikania micrantha]|uniref:CCHC-type domain-containing protein n=1 Tax=Mikania micrantha TaxID=192012 RepID=A0A5N6NHJ7_9ASTR|nr:hypothetical protein E3N88_24138 [Mikania micrantha]
MARPAGEVVVPVWEPDLTRDIRDKLLLGHDDQQAKEKKGKLGGCDCFQQNREIGRFIRAEVGCEGQQGREQKRQHDKSRAKCYRYKEFGHYAYECPKSKPKEEEANLT